MWLQLAQAIDGDTEFVRCEKCKAWIARSVEHARADRRYCGNACRQKAYRDRNRRPPQPSRKRAGVR